jgi:heat-inducible transcriptional repressor
MSDLSSRARQVLYHAVTEYVATGEPVGSRTLSKKSGLNLSPASIRNVLSDLEEAGYLRQPHASSGRVPTDRAFRLFIDALMKLHELSDSESALIRERVSALVAGPSFLRETGKFLSELTGTAAVVMAPRAETQTLTTMRFIRVSSEQLLAVLVLADGTVQNRFLQVQLSEDDLTRIHNLLDQVIEGRTLGELRDLFARRLFTESVQHDPVQRRAFELGDEALSSVMGAAKDLVIEGHDRLLDKPEFAGPDGMKQVVSALDAREKLMKLLDATLEAKGGTVTVGFEAGELGGGQLSIVGAAYKNHGQTAGSVGVIGPTRMDYPKVLPLVMATAHAVGEMLDRPSRKGHDP